MCIALIRMSRAFFVQMNGLVWWREIMCASKLVYSSGTMESRLFITKNPREHNPGNCMV